MRQGRPGIKLDIVALKMQIIALAGNISAVANVFGVHRHTIMRRIEKSKELREILEDAREMMLDNAESKLYSKVLNGETVPLIFFLKTQGRKRGYGDKPEPPANPIPLFEEMADLINTAYDQNKPQSKK